MHFVFAVIVIAYLREAIVCDLSEIGRYCPICEKGYIIETIDGGRFFYGFT